MLVLENRTAKLDIPVFELLGQFGSVIIRHFDWVPHTPKK